MTGRKMAGARSLWRANGAKEEHFLRPVIGIVNSFTQFVPGHVHLHEIGQQVKKKIEALGCFAAEFNTIAIDDGIAMGHSGMLYSLPSRDLIADSVEYMCNAHTVDAIVCISNCDKITPGMLMAAMRLNIPAIFVSGGPMEAGVDRDKHYDLVDAIILGADDTVSSEDVARIERCACPTCGSCSGMFTANSMNCLSEALGFSLPGNGTIVATHQNRLHLFDRAAERIVAMAEAFYDHEDLSVLPRSIATKAAFTNAMALDIAMGGSTNTVLHLLAIAREGEVDFTMADIDALSRRVPNLCKVAPNSGYHIEDVNRAGGVIGILGELERGGLLDTAVRRADGTTLKEALELWDLRRQQHCSSAEVLYKSAPAHSGRNLTMGSQATVFKELDLDRENGCIRDLDHCYSREGGLAVLFGNIAENGCIVKDVVVILYEGPRGGPGMQEMLYPTSYLKSMHLGKECALITDGRFSGGTSGLSIGHISPEAAAGGTIGLLKNGDTVHIDIKKRTINVELSREELAARRRQEEARKEQAWTPPERQRPISRALRAYALFASSADTGAVRRLPGEE